MDPRLLDLQGLNAALFDLSPAGVLVTSESGEIEAVNPAFSRITGFSQADCAGKTPRLWRSGRQDENFYRDMWRRLTNDREWRGALWNKRKNGEFYQQELSIRLLPRDGKRRAHFIGVMREIEPLPAVRDPLTKLFMRDVFLDSLARALRMAHEQNHKIAIVFIDLDGFKALNDTFGHMAGDAVLAAVADRLRACLRPTDILARMGGDEFAILFAPLEPLSAAAALSSRLLHAIARPIEIVPMGARQPVEITPLASIGVVTGPWSHEQPEEMLAAADAAMYAVKRRHPHRVCAVTSPGPHRS